MPAEESICALLTAVPAVRTDSAANQKHNLLCRFVAVAFNRIYISQRNVIRNRVIEGKTF